MSNNLFIINSKTMEKKKCYSCKEVKNLNEFNKNRTRGDGLSSDCKICCSVRNKIITEKQKIKTQEKDKLKESQIAEEYIGKEFGSYVITEYVGKICKDNTGYRRFFFKKECKYCGFSNELPLSRIKSLLNESPKCHLCKETFNIHTKQKKCNLCCLWFDATPNNFPRSKNRTFGLHYYCFNCHNKKSKKRRESKDVRNKEYEQKKIRLKNDHLFKLGCNLRSLIRSSFVLGGFKKNTKTQVILGCSFLELKNYFESKFEPWMTWENRGLYNGEKFYGWDIDHIIPVSSANTIEELIKLNHYSNLQPLCSYINRVVKRDSLNWDADSPETRPPSFYKDQF